MQACIDDGDEFSDDDFGDDVMQVSTLFTLSIRTPQLLIIYVLKFEPVQFTTRCCV